MWKIQSYGSTGSAWDFCNHYKGFPLPSPLITTFLAPPPDSSLLEEAAQSSAQSMNDILTLQKDLRKVFLVCESLNSQPSECPLLAMVELHTVSRDVSLWLTHQADEKEWVKISKLEVWNIPD